jgi:hypothetical protein
MELYTNIHKQILCLIKASEITCVRYAFWLEKKITIEVNYG